LTSHKIGKKKRGTNTRWNFGSKEKRGHEGLRKELQQDDENSLSRGDGRVKGQFKSVQKKKKRTQKGRIARKKLYSNWETRDVTKFRKMLGLRRKTGDIRERPFTLGQKKKRRSEALLNLEGRPGKAEKPKNSHFLHLTEKGFRRLSTNLRGSCSIMLEGCAQKVSPGSGCKSVKRGSVLKKIGTNRKNLEKPGGKKLS